MPKLITLSGIAIDPLMQISAKHLIIYDQLDRQLPMINTSETPDQVLQDLRDYFAHELDRRRLAPKLKR